MLCHIASVTTKIAEMRGPNVHSVVFLLVAVVQSLKLQSKAVNTNVDDITDIRDTEV